jgi:hypothetical protein
MSRWDEPELTDDSTTEISSSDEQDLEELDPSEAIDARHSSSTEHTGTERLPVPEVTDRWDVRTDSGERRLPDSVVSDPDAEVTREGTRRVYSALCAMAHVEHRPTAAQRQELLDYQDYLGVSPWVAKLIEQQARRSPELRVGRRVSELELVMNAMIDMACADGSVSLAEGRLLARVNERAGWSREQVGAAIKRSLARQAAAAKAAPVVDEPVAARPVREQASEASGLFGESDVQPVAAAELDLADPAPEVIEIQAIQTDRAIRVVEPIEVEAVHEPDEPDARGEGLLPLSDEQPIAETFRASVWDASGEAEPRDEVQGARDELDKLDELLSCLSRRTLARGVTPAAERGRRPLTKKTPRKPLEALALVGESVDAPIGLQSVDAPNPFEDSGDEELVLLSPATLPLRKRA